MVESESEDNQPSSHHLVNGQAVTLLSDEFVVTDATGRETARVRFDEITVLQRGGADVIVVRGYRDPVMLRFVGVAAAAAFEQSLGAQQLNSRWKRPQHRWWQFWRCS